MKLTCKRCEHKWTARSEHKPVVCARCKSYKWESPKDASVSYNEAHENPSAAKAAK
jgi:hypothetical protein